MQQDEKLTTQTNPKPPEYLVVAFHGSYLFNFWPNIVEVLVPRVPGHMYLVEEGSRDEETEGHANSQRRFGLLDGGTHALSGVEDSDATYTIPNREESVIISKHRPVASDESLFCRLLVPRPDSIQRLLLFKPKDPCAKVFCGASAPEIKAREFPSCLAFIYENVNPDICELRFGDLPWQPVVDGKCVVHLRIYAESTGRETDHPSHAFDRLASLVHDLDVTMVPGVIFDPVKTCPERPVNEIDAQNLRTRLGLSSISAFKSTRLGANPPADCGAMRNYHTA